MVNGRTMSSASVMLCRGKFTDGDTLCRMDASSDVPCFSRVSAGTTSTGTASSSAAWCCAREPVTTIDASCVIERLRVTSCTTVSPARMVTLIVVGVYPMSRTRTLAAPAGIPTSRYVPLVPDCVRTCV